MNVLAAIIDAVQSRCVYNLEIRRGERIIENMVAHM